MDMDRAFEGLKLIAKRCWQTSEDKGWHQEKDVYARMSSLATVAKEEGAPFTAESASLAANALGGERTRGVPVMSKLMLICTEVAEAAEVFRNKDFNSLQTCYQHGQFDNGALGWIPYADDAEPPAKPEGLGSELADIVIRVCDLAEDLGIDLATEVKRKMRYNATRAHRHGGKLA